MKLPILMTDPSESASAWLAPIVQGTKNVSLTACVEVRVIYILVILPRRNAFAKMVSTKLKRDTVLASMEVDVSLGLIPVKMD